MVNHADASMQANEPQTAEQPERPDTGPEDQEDWRSEFRSYLDDPE
jgi:hypothetical protein